MIKKISFLSRTSSPPKIACDFRGIEEKNMGFPQKVLFASQQNSLLEASLKLWDISKAPDLRSRTGSFLISKKSEKTTGEKKKRLPKHVGFPIRDHIKKGRGPFFIRS